MMSRPKRVQRLVACYSILTSVEKMIHMYRTSRKKKRGLCGAITHFRLDSTLLYRRETLYSKPVSQRCWVSHVMVRSTSALIQPKCPAERHYLYDLYLSSAENLVWWYHPLPPRFNSILLRRASPFPASVSPAA